VRKLILAALALGAASPASAQGFFTLDAVFVSRFLAQPDSLDAEAQELHRLLEKYLSDSFLVTPLDSVLAFDDYSAAVYLENCPPAEYNECSYVIASRAKANWAITARYSSEDSFDSFAPRNVDISIIDVESSRAVISFGASVASDKEDVFAQGVAGVLNKIIQGERDITDIREDMVDDKAVWEHRREVAAAAAEELAGYEDIDLIVRGMEFEDELDKPKMKIDDLSEYDDRDDEGPWERLNMSREEFVRYKNSGRSLVNWRELGNGRTRRVLVKILGSTGAGPYHHRFDGRTALDDDTLQPVEVDVYQEVQTGGFVGGTFEVGFGITPTIDVAFGTTLRTGTYTTFFHQEKVGDPEPERFDIVVPWFTPSYTISGTYAPLPTSGVRPFGTGGLTQWVGSSVHQVVGDQMPREVAELAGVGGFPAPKFIMLNAGGGLEARMGDQLDFVLKASMQYKLVGKSLEQFHSGPEVLYTRGIPTGGGSIGFSIGAGIILRLAPFGVPKVEGESDPLWDDEPIEDF